MITDLALWFSRLSLEAMARWFVCVFFHPMSEKRTDYIRSTEWMSQCNICGRTWTPDFDR